jgi:PIN domain nuclease of toxin-antitoxin system
MNCLLDTSTFLWWLTDQSALTPRALQTMLDSRNSLTLSAASVWEMAIKVKLRKLRVAGDLADILETQARVNGLYLLPIAVTHALGTLNLPMHHRDPFDRMLVAQAQAESLTLITSDARIAKYDVEVLW